MSAPLANNAAVSGLGAHFQILVAASVWTIFAAAGCEAVRGNVIETLSRGEADTTGVPILSTTSGSADQTTSDEVSDTTNTLLTTNTGFREFELRDGAQRIYVSSSEGADDNDGLSQDEPVKTIARGISLLRQDMGDWLLLRRADTWKEGIGHFKVSGHSTPFPTVISSYRDVGHRPILMTGADKALYIQDSDPIENLAIVGLYFWADARDPESDRFVGDGAGGNAIELIGTHRDIWIEDCVIDSYAQAVVATGGEIDTISIRRNIIVDNYGTPTLNSNSNAVYIDEAEGVLIEENFFDHNGWREDVSGYFALPTTANHTLELRIESTTPVVRGNVIARASSHAVRLLGGGDLTDNFVIEAPLAISHAGNGQVTDNVIFAGKDIDAENPRGWGIDVKPGELTKVYRNFHLHNDGGQPQFFEIKDSGGGELNVRDNTWYNWGGEIVTPESGNATVEFTNNITWGEVLSGEGNLDGQTLEFFDPTRTVETYMESMGKTGGRAEFYQLSRSRGPGEWHEELSAQGVNSYLRVGYALK